VRYAGLVLSPSMLTVGEPTTMDEVADMLEDGRRCVGFASVWLLPSESGIAAEEFPLPRWIAGDL
jgi:hypothetical protein